MLRSFQHTSIEAVYTTVQTNQAVLLPLLLTMLFLQYHQLLLCVADTHGWLLLPHPASVPHALQDEVTRYRAVLRSQNLFNKSHSVPHNIITGEARHNPVGLPPAPAPPHQE